MEKIKNILNNRKCLKLICGAGNENLKEIEKLSYVFSKAGFNMIDVCAKSDVIKAAQNGVKLAGMENDVFICVSIGIQDDIHVSKVVINKQKCTMCGICSDLCIQNAVYIEDDKYIADDKKCIGCLKCLENCPSNAIISEHKYKAPHTMLLPLLAEKIDCIEFHCSGTKTDEIIDSWNKIKSIYKGMLSICLDRSKLSDDSIIALLKEMIKGSEDYSVIIQADGKPMSGGDDDYKSTLQTVAFSELIQRENLPVYIILSGGTNSKSTKLAKQCDVNVNGAALGSYARKLVKEYINSDDFFENTELQNLAVMKARNLADELILYL